MSMLRRNNRELPTLNTSSLPDLIFTVLFFFMIVTHMRQVTLKVRYQVPAGTELTKLTRKSAVSYVYIGFRGDGKGNMTSGSGGRPVIQLNDKFATPDDITDYIADERNGMSPQDLEVMTVSIKADRGTDMGTITDVKQALRNANALRINYSAVNRGRQ